MKKMKRSLNLMLGALAILGVGVTPAQAAGIPVIDSSNLRQNMVTSLESAAQTLKQIEEYRTQLKQYENQLRNTLAPSAYIWDQAVSTVNKLRTAMNSLDYYKNQLGNIDAYLNKFQDLNYYRNSPCFRARGCTEAEWAATRRAMSENRRLGSESQKKANDAVLRILESQQDALQSDARSLERLQQGAQGAQGQMQALGYANQLASHQANQLLQLRAMMLTMYGAQIARMQAIADREALHQAAGEKFRRGTFVRSEEKVW